MAVEETVEEIVGERRLWCGKVATGQFSGPRRCRQGDGHTGDPAFGLREERRYLWTGHGDVAEQREVLDLGAGEAEVRVVDVDDASVDPASSEGERRNEAPGDGEVEVGRCPAQQGGDVVEHRPRVNQVSVVEHDQCGVGSLCE